MKSAQDLLRLKKQIEDTKEKRSRLDGQLIQLKKRMKEELGTDDWQAAQKKIDAMKDQLAGLEEQITEGIKSLEKELGQ